MTQNSAIPIVMTKVSQIGKIGPMHMDINYNNASGGIRGPFLIEPLKNKSAPTYPVLWSHDAKQREVHGIRRR